MSGAALDAGARSALAVALDLGLRSAVIIGVAALSAACCRRARLRAQVWTAALGVSVVLPLLYVVLPPARWVVDPPVAQGDRATSSASLVTRTEQRVASWAVEATAPSSAKSVGTDETGASFPWMFAIALGGSVITLVCLARVIQGLRTVSAIRSAARRVDDPVVVAQVAALAARSGLTWTPRLLESPSLVVPAAVGLVSPAIVLAADWREWTGETLETVLVHELTHIARHDTRTVALAQVFRAVAWANPAAWWLHRQLLDVAEEACDEAALEQGIAPTAYAETLLTFVRRVSTSTVRPVVFLAMARSNGRRSEARIDRVLSWTSASVSASRQRLATTAALLSVATVGLLAAVRVHAESTTNVLGASRFANAGDVGVVPPTVADAIDVRPPSRAEHAVGRARKSSQEFTAPVRSDGSDMRSATNLPTDLAMPNPPGLSWPLLIHPLQERRDPVALQRVDPVYTAEALARKEEGDVDLEAVIAMDGHPAKVRVIRSLDKTTGLDDEAVRAARQWVFEPGDKPVTVGMVMEFRLTRRSAEPVVVQRPRPLADAFAAGAYDANAIGIVPPQAVNIPLPKYSSWALRDRLSGDVEVEAVVATDGHVSNARVIQSLDQTAGLDENALAAARASVFTPGTLNGQPVPVIATMTLHFTLH